MDGETSHAADAGDPRPRVVATIGVFDGLHRGHAALIEGVCRHAAAAAAAPAVVTFDPPPQVVLVPRDDPFQITPWEVKRRLLLEAGIEHIVLIRFTPDVAAVTPVDFIERTLLAALSPVGFVIGYDFRFGARAAGNAALLRQLGGRHGFFVEEVEAVREAGAVISSSRVRETLMRGAVERARDLLGRPFAFQATVVRGKGVGRRVLVPTANLVPDPDQLLPAAGVYAVDVFVEGHRHRAVAMVGASPTLPGTGEPAGGGERLVEAHLLDFSEDLVGQRLEIAFLERIREGRRFAGVEQLRLAIEEDIRLARRRLAEEGRNRLVSRAGE
ncbi:MAG: riboflavin biosynthesis protein RibF [Candidatus Eisenbacteria bacterium]